MSFQPEGEIFWARINKIFYHKTYPPVESVAEVLVCQSELVEDYLGSKNSHFDKLSVTEKLNLQHSR